MSVLILLLAGGVYSQAASADAYFRLDQMGYPSSATAQVSLMSTQSLAGQAVLLKNAAGTTVWTGSVPKQAQSWDKYSVYALSVPLTATAGSYYLTVGQPVAAQSPTFAVGDAGAMNAPALLRALHFYQNQRDGSNYIASALRTAPGHLNDAQSAVYFTPTFDSNDNVVGSLQPTGAVINASGGWSDAGDYLKFVETTSYTTAILAVGARDFPSWMGVSSAADFSAEIKFGLNWLSQMWDDGSRTLYYQTGIGAVSASVYGDHDLWRLPQADDTYGGSDATYQYIRNRPTFIANSPGSLISPNLAGRLAADFALCYQLFRTSDTSRANACLAAGEHVFALADTAPSSLITVAPFDFYPESQWRDDLELGATELALALRAGAGHLPSGLAVTDPNVYLTSAAHWANAYLQSSDVDTLNLYDVSGLAHFELYRALAVSAPSGLEVSQADLLADLQAQLSQAQSRADSDPFGFGFSWGAYDSATHGAGLAVTAFEVAALTGSSTASDEASRWAGNILGENAWGASFIVGDGQTFPVCIHHQIANLAGSLNGSGAILEGALVEGPNAHGVMGTPYGANACPAKGGNPYRAFNGNRAVFRDTVGSYSTVEPAIDLTAASVLMFAWRANAGALPQLAPTASRAGLSTPAHR